MGMGGYAVQAMFTWQGEGATKPSPGIWDYTPYLGVVLCSGEMGRPCFQLAGRQAEAMWETARAKAQEIMKVGGWSEGRTATEFFRINQEDFSEVFAGFGLERENERNSTYLFMVFDTESMALKEHSFVRQERAESDTRQSRYIAWKAMIPDRFRCPPPEKKPKLVIRRWRWWDAW